MIAYILPYSQSQRNKAYFESSDVQIIFIFLALMLHFTSSYEFSSLDEIEEQLKQKKSIKAVCPTSSISIVCVLRVVPS